MEKLDNPYERLQQYDFVIQGLRMSGTVKGENAIPLKKLSEASSVPMEILRADIACLMEISLYEYDLVADGESIIDRYEKTDTFDWKSFRKDMTEGVYDDAELEVYVSDADKVILPLSAEESSIMEQVLHEHYNKKAEKIAPFLIKDSYHFTYQDEKKLNDTLFNIREAIREKKEIRIRDLSEDRKPVILMKPVRLLYDTTENLYAVVCLKEEGLCAIRVDKIDYLGRGKSFKYPEDIEKRLSIIPNVWGLDFSDKPMKVRVKFYRKHSRGNVGRSVKKDLERRTKGKLFEEGDFLIYEDTVYGKEAFLRWVFGYGASAVIEKPIALRKEIIGILEKELERVD